MTTGVSFSTISLDKVCEQCGTVFTPNDYRQRVCRKNCGRSFETKPVRFVGVDGEGLGSDPSCYVLFGAGSRHIANINGLQWKEVFEFLYGEYLRHGKGVAFVGFFLGYDFTQILKTLPEDRARMLLTIEGKAKRRHRVKGKEPHPVEYEGWQFDILGSKRLRIRPKQCSCSIASCRCKKASWCFLCDVGGFWQTSFLNVIDPTGWRTPILSAEVYERIRVGKENRAFADFDQDMIDYMHLEIEALESAMSVLCEGFEDIGIHLSPKQWFGPGQASAQWLKGKVRKRDELQELIPDWFRNAAQDSYYGGWFETFCHGIIPGETYEYDINSAYPSIIASLPCLEHGTYTRGTDEPTVQSPRSLCLVKARVFTPGHGVRGRDNVNTQIGTMLHRNRDGSICRPDITEGWYWLEELETAQRAKCIGRVEYQEWVMYEPCDCPLPFAGIEELYQGRLSQGKTSPLGKGSKLVYNSAYGKFAQSIGEPQFGNAIYASRITSGCRTQILDAIASHPDGHKSVAMVATDAVFFLSPHPLLECSDILGQWDMAIKHNLTIFKPGVYWDDETRRQIREGTKPKFKARGINAAQFASEIWKIDFWFNDWGIAQNIEWPDASFDTGFSIITALQALMRNRWELAGKNDPKTMYHSSNPYRKRDGIWFDGEYCVWRSGILRRPYDWTTGDYSNVQSYAYTKAFGMDDPFSDESREEFGVTEDGMVSDTFRFLLRNDE
jgi:hypothetical protein